MVVKPNHYLHSRVYEDSSAVLGCKTKIVRIY